MIPPPAARPLHALVWLVTLGAAGCAAPTEPPDDPGRSGGGAAVTFDATLAVSAALPGSWLRVGDSVAVTLHIAPGDDGTAAGQAEGTIGYEGIPIWYPAPSSAGAFEASYFTHAELGDRLIGVFWGEHLAGARLVLIVDPNRLAMQWAVTVSGADGQAIEVARGTGARIP